MRLSDLHEDKDVSILGKAIKMHLDRGHVVWLDFQYKQSDNSAPPSDFHGNVRSIEKRDDANYVVTWDLEGRDDEEYWPGNTLHIDSQMDNELTIEPNGENFMGKKIYKVVNIHAVNESAQQPTLLWLAIKHALNKDGAFVEINVPKSLWKKLSPTYKPSGFAANGKLRARVIGALKGNRINTKDPVLQLLLTPEMDDELEFIKLYDDEPSYMIRPL